MRYLIFLFALALVACGSPGQPEPVVRIFSTGEQNDPGGQLAFNGGHSIRIDNGEAILRFYHVVAGNSVLQFQEAISSSRNPMLWITPSVQADDVVIRFGGWTEEPSSVEAGTFNQVVFDKPHRVGGGGGHRGIEVTSKEQELAKYWIETAPDLTEDSEMEYLEVTVSLP